ncbi:MAG: hypothetical protein II475_02780, partial [Bacteroidales bacterium]|nr:hypothetical protein [Bacteroidales bacterium]
MVGFYYYGYAQRMQGFLYAISYLDGESFSLSEFYTNVIDASETAGSTFFIPTAFRIAGIVTDSSLLDEEQKGFT